MKGRRRAVTENRESCNICWSWSMHYVMYEVDQLEKNLMQEVEKKEAEDIAEVSAEREKQEWSLL
eukprot:8012486-Prorocentrum_lima.AAC.1